MVDLKIGKVEVLAVRWDNPPLRFRPGQTREGPWGLFKDGYPGMPLPLCQFCDGDAEIVTEKAVMVGPGQQVRIHVPCCREHRNLAEMWSEKRAEELENA